MEWRVERDAEKYLQDVYALDAIPEDDIFQGPAKRLCAERADTESPSASSHAKPLPEERATEDPNADPIDEELEPPEHDK